ncbi:hypothetical protein ETR_19648 [Erwinia tracheiphila PSU-1]|nr:hypothetical protein ETR_19648 [Erwinia tracheiphila PSU-1]
MVVKALQVGDPLHAVTEVLQVMSLPDGTHSAAGDKHAFFTQLITGPVLTGGRELNGVLNNRPFSGFVGAVFQVVPRRF